MTLFFTENITEQIIHLEPDQSKHLAQVLRLKEGDKIKLTNGKGVMCECEIVDPNPKKTLVKITQRIDEFEKKDYKIILAVAPTKNIDRYEWLLEKTTEIGVDKIVPILCEHSERKIVRKERAEKVVLSAVKQSFKAYLPQIEEITKLDQFLKNVDPKWDKFIAHCDNANEKIELKNAVKKGTDSVILIGPEGDFSEAEVQMAKKYGFKSVGLGKARLRTETAAVYAVTMFAIENL